MTLHFNNTTEFPMNKKSLLVLPVALLFAARVEAQQQIAMTSTIVVPTVLYLATSAAASTGSVAFGTVSEADFNAGFKASTSTTTLASAANVRNSIVVWTAATSMSGSAGTSSTDAVSSSKSVADLEYSTDGGTSWTGLANAASAAAGARLNTSLTQRARGDFRTTGTTAVTYRMKLAYGSDTPGTYTLNFNYTIIAD